MPEITLKKNTIYLNKRQTVQSFLFIPESSISVQGQGASRYGRGKAACFPRYAISMVLLACVVGPWK